MMTLTDADVMALTLWGEARGEETEGRIAVASVIRNRLRSTRWGQSYTSVCRAPKQFSCWNDDVSGNHHALMLLAADLMAGKTSADPAWLECRWIAQGCLSGAMLDRVSGATHYFADSIQPPAWAKGHDPICQVGRHVFYRGIA